LSEEGSNNTSKPKISTCRITRETCTKIDEALYFVIEEKNNQVELTDNGIKYLSGDTDSDFCPSRHWN
jgi:preprotein translocase subunit SecA